MRPQRNHDGWQQARARGRTLKRDIPRSLAIGLMNVDIYETQLTVILGHNGAGKTTLLNILAGEYTSYRDLSLSENNKQKNSNRKLRNNQFPTFQGRLDSFFRGRLNRMGQARASTSSSSSTELMFCCRDAGPGRK
ncbi:ABC transporter, putative [Ixodes scapularis]|uniref:ABC transporter, putative n=1 Tax=Ixodes scapularis TaxID=6945 RepID=B7P3F5_IXOSC|nr:ABC transporter, putative [Ixodes scapularis]|eukprot:XP_002404085.1 ABC transporter, putative [Ixodes scapularis]